MHVETEPIELITGNCPGCGQKIEVSGAEITDDPIPCPTCATKFHITKLKKRNIKPAPSAPGSYSHNLCIFCFVVAIIALASIPLKFFVTIIDTTPASYALNWIVVFASSALGILFGIWSRVIRIHELMKK